MPGPLEAYTVLIADQDTHLSHILKNMLEDMGFARVRLTHSGQHALELLQEVPFDFLITEWETRHMSGLNLIRHIRKHDESPNPTLPIIMVSGRAEQTDVLTARDIGINEYIIKPFSAGSVYNRLERIIDKPRQFVVAHDFVGPDRRHKGLPPEGVSDRRILKIKATEMPDGLTGNLQSGELPKIWLPDYSLKNKIGKDLSLKALITPAMINLAQASIDSIESESLQWIKQNLNDLKLLHRAMVDGRHATGAGKRMMEVALTLNARAGTFGFKRASEIAYMLYLFCRNRLQYKNAGHHIVIMKHIEVLHVVLSNDSRGMDNAEGGAIVSELHNLVNKFIV